MVKLNFSEIFLLTGIYYWNCKFCEKLPSLNLNEKKGFEYSYFSYRLNLYILHTFLALMYCYNCWDDNFAAYTLCYFYTMTVGQQIYQYCYGDDYDDREISGDKELKGGCGFQQKEDI